MHRMHVKMMDVMEGLRAHVSGMVALIGGRSSVPGRIFSVYTAGARVGIQDNGGSREVFLGWA